MENFITSTLSGVPGRNLVGCTPLKLPILEACRMLHIVNGLLPGISCSLRTADVSSRSSPLRDVSRGGTSATQRQKFHTDDVNQRLLNKYGVCSDPSRIATKFNNFLANIGPSLAVKFHLLNFLIKISLLVTLPILSF